MKKFFAVLLVVTMIASMATVVSAADTTTLTTTVPAATYTLNIPADQEIEFGALQTDIGTLTITDGAGFANGKNVQVTVTYTAFKSDAVSTTIPFSMWKATEEQENADKNSLPSGSILTFHGKYDGTISEFARESFRYNDSLYGPLHEDLTVDKLYIQISSNDWGKALAGEYTATITFTCEVVVEE